MRRLSSLKAWAAYIGVSAFGEYSGPHVPDTIPHPVPGGIETIYRMIDTARKPEQRGLVAMMGLMGMRVSEAIECRRSWFNLNDMSCRILGKGEKFRYVPVSDESLEILISLITKSFLSGDTPLAPYSDRHARMIVTRIGQKLELPRSISSHDLRGTWATHFYNLTRDIRLTQELLGHSSVTTSQIYIEANMQLARSTVAQFRRSA